MSALFDRHRKLIDAAVLALRERGFWSPFSEIPSTKIYGETAKEDGLAAFEARLNAPFQLPGHPEQKSVGGELSPWGMPLNISYPTADSKTLVAASKAAAPVWASASVEERAGICAEILVRLNRMSFEIASAVMHTTGQAFPMAFQAGGPHAQDRGLEALAVAWSEMSRAPREAIWEKPQGKASPIILEKHWRIVPRGISLVIGCQTFPTWNSYPGLFASLATGNTVIVKPHPGAVLPLAITVAVAREVMAGQGFPADVVLLAADAQGAEITKDLVQHPDVAIIDYTGSNAFGDWVRSNAGSAQVYTEEAGVNSIVISATDRFDAMCANIAFSLALYSGQMCTAPQNLFIPRDGIPTDLGHKSFDEVGQTIASAIDVLLADPARGSGVCGAIANQATLERVENARMLGRVVRDSAPLEGSRSATPLIVAVDAAKTSVHEEECFGPIAFLVAVADADEGIEHAAALACRKGAITTALYDIDEPRIERGIEAFARAGVNLSVNLTGNIFVNQSAAFSDYHVTGANPAGNASLTDAAFVTNRYRLAMWRRPKAA
ncbi:phenylacetic acid degradation protein PaaN [Microvirga terricola]|uniref:Phenylacetic acid degradation protein PaaN n=1 Tax=Microvirga terricola TaxID=2719797 RepID=A0ABX0V851_9HYPH|nr:phenylacetic acid degradation protein PaaN [Microvirga terricola]NIX75877.1 phenylacetic acid degradation protein PaaN [Microvirga terricola]